MRGRLVRDDVDGKFAGALAAQHLREDVGGVAHQADRERTLLFLRGEHELQGLVQVGRYLVEVALGLAALEAGFVHIDDEHRASIERDRERLGAAHAATAAGESQRAGECAAKALARDGGEGLEGALEDALRGDVNPGPGRHLAVHHEPLVLELAEVLPVGPVAHEVGVGDEHARRPFVGLPDAHGLAGLDEQGLIGFQVLERVDDGVESLPRACGAAGAAVDHEVLGALRDLRVQVVHEHAQRCFSLPRLGVERRAARGADFTGCRHGSSFLRQVSCAWLQGRLPGAVPFYRGACLTKVASVMLMHEALAGLGVWDTRLPEGRKKGPAWALLLSAAFRCRLPPRPAASLP